MPRKPAPKRGNDRIKLAVAGGLGLLLLYLVVSGGGGSSEVADGAVELGPRRVFGPAASSDTQTNKLSRQSTPPAPVAAAPLPRLPLETIANRDPFTITAVLTQSLPPTDESSEPEASLAVPASQMPVDQIQAVYKTADGSTALFEGQIVPVKEPERLIDVIRRQPVIPAGMSPGQD